MFAPTPRPIEFSRTGISRYNQLATLFRRRIEAGQWVVGDQIPTIDELAEECGVARATIRQALDLLEDEKLIERFRAKGTFVLRRPKDDLWCEVGTDWSGLLRPSYDATIEILKDERRGNWPTTGDEIGIQAPSYRHVRRRHWRDGTPFLLADLFIDDRLRSKISKKDLGGKTALRLISEVPGVEITDAKQTLTIGSADLETSDLLAVPLGAPVAYVRRQAVDCDGVLVLLANGTYRGDVVRFDIKLR